MSAAAMVSVFSWSTAEALLLNFRDVDVRQIIETVGELTGRNFIIDPRVKAKVTILANEEVPEDALYDVLLSILAMHGFRAVESVGMTRVVPINQGARFAPGRIPEDLVTEIISVRHLAAPTIVPMIKPLMTQQAQLAVHKETNIMIVTESRSNIERVKAIIGKIDQKSLLDHEVIQLRHMLASDAAKIVSRATRKSVRGLVEVISEDENNRIILAGSPDVRLSIRALIAELDTPVRLSRIEGELQVIPLRYAKAEDIEDILSSLLNSRFLESTAPLDAKGKPAPKKQPKKGDKKITAKKRGDRNKDRKYVVQSDPATNSIIIGGTPEILDVLKGIIRRLDVPRPQVLIEAIIADVSDNKVEALGAQIGLGARRDASGNLALSGSGVVTSPNDYGGLLGVFTQGTALLGVTKARRAGRDPEISDRNMSRLYTPLSLLINAIRQNDDSEVLSTPSILTLNNESAVIDVSDERSVLTGDSTASDSVGDTRRTYERIKFGTRLEVLPQITEGAAVRLEVRQVVEDIEPDSVADDRPNTRSREIETTVVVNDGDILMLGGLARKNRALADNRIPLLSDIPVVGDLLFRDRNETALRTNLVLFIRPTILRNAGDSAKLSEERYAALRLRQLMQLRDTHERGLLDEPEYEILLPGLEEMSRRGGKRPFMEEQRGKRRLERSKQRRKKRVLRRRPPVDDV